MTLKRKNNHFNVISVPELIENEVLHQFASAAAILDIISFTTSPDGLIKTKWINGFLDS